MASANEIAAVILARNTPTTTSMSLQKLLYYVQSWHLAIAGKPIFPEKFKAWKDGPVVPTVWHQRRAPKTRQSVSQDLSEIALSDFESDLIDLVLSNYSSLSGDELSELTHIETPWLEARGNLGDSEHSSNPLDEETIKSFYRTERKLAGFTAVDIAAGGMPMTKPSDSNNVVDLSAILNGVSAETEHHFHDDPWGGANLARTVA